MKLVLYKRHEGQNVIKIEKEFGDAIALKEFLDEQGMPLSLSECASDILLPQVVYTVPLLGVLDV